MISERRGEGGGIVRHHSNGPITKWAYKSKMCRLIREILRHLYPIVLESIFVDSLKPFVLNPKVRLKERKVKLEKYIRTVEVFQGVGTEIEMRVMGIMSFVSVEIIVTDLENIRDQLQHVQVCYTQ